MLSVKHGAASLAGIDPVVWDRYAASHPAATPYHLCDWPGVVEAAYAHPCCRVAVSESTRGGAETLRGILPLVHFRGPAGLNRLISLPFLDCAGLLADDPEAEKRLLQGALDLAAELGAAHLEIRQDHPTCLPLGEQLAGIAPGGCYRAHNFKVGLRRDLPGTEEILWRQFPAKLRNQVRKAKRNDCLATVGGRELLSDFYGVFSHNMRDLGSPVHAREFFAAILDRFPDRARIVLVRQGGSPAAAALVFRFGTGLYNPWASSLRSLRPLCPNMLLYWEMLAFACRERLAFFDFGRSSPRSPTFAFKRQWGATARPLTWHVLSSHGAPWDPLRESLVIDSWPDLDLQDSRRLGPTIRRWISL